MSGANEEEEVLALLSHGSFRCRPCSNCRNSDPFQLELTQKDPAVQHESGPTSCLLCKKCQKPYNVDEDDDDDAADDDGDGQLARLDRLDVNDDNAASSFSGTPECRKCHNKEKDLFSASVGENGQLQSVECLVCEHRDTSRDDKKNFDFSEWIECSKCPNRTRDLFLVTQRDDGRIHKVTCMACGHGNTLHDPGHRHLRRDPGAVQPYRQLLSWGGSVWNSLAAVYSAVAPSAQRSIQSAGDQGAQQVARNLQNRRPVAQGLRQIGVRALVSLGEEMVVLLGNKYLRNVVSSAVTRNAAANFGELIRNMASVKLEETQKAKKTDRRLQQQLP